MKASSIIQLSPFIENYPERIDMLMCDLAHPTIQGNKWFKLKYNITAMREQQKEAMVTFGGAYSNHIAAVAAAGKENGFKTIGVIRGEAAQVLNPTLRLAGENGMELEFLSREAFRKLREDQFLMDGFKNCYLLPEGGSNVQAVKGCAEILHVESAIYDVICCPTGTGATLAGIIAASNPHQQIIGFSAVKNGEFLNRDVEKLLLGFDEQEGTNHAKKSNWQIRTNFHFGGYAAPAKEVFEFVGKFQKNTGVQLDYIYNGKMLLALEMMIENGELDKKSILCINTGGLQGNAGMLKRRRL